MKTTTLILVTLVAIALAGGAFSAEEPAAAVAASEQAPALDAALGFSTREASEPACESTDALAVDLGQTEAAAGGACAKDQCRRDKDCDRVCGKGWGVCEPDDTSCHTRRCLCAG